MRLRVAVVIGILSFILGVLGNLLASWLQQNVFNNVFNTPSIIVIGICVIIFILLVAVLTSQPAPTKIPPSRVNLSRSTSRFVLLGVLIIGLLFGVGGGYLLYPRISNLFAVETQDQLYSRVTSVSPVLNDSLHGQDGNQWDEYDTTSGGCTFKEGAYHSYVLKPYVAECYAQGPKFSNYRCFALQVQMMLIKGDGAGGLIFGANDPSNLSSREYRFVVKPSDTYYDLYVLPTGKRPASSTSPAIKDNLNAPNLLTVIVCGNTIYLFINMKFVDQAQMEDNASAPDKIGMFAVDGTHNPTEVVFRDVKVWVLK